MPGGTQEMKGWLDFQGHSTVYNRKRPLWYTFEKVALSRVDLTWCKVRSIGLLDFLIYTLFKVKRQVKKFFLQYAKMGQWIFQPRRDTFNPGPNITQDYPPSVKKGIPCFLFVLGYLTCSYIRMFLVRISEWILFVYTSDNSRNYRLTRFSEISEIIGCYDFLDLNRFVYTNFFNSYRIDFL